MLDNLRATLRDVFKLRGDGVAYARLARGHGYVDGYTRALLESEALSERELLDLVCLLRPSEEPNETTVLTFYQDRIANEAYLRIARLDRR